MRPDGLVSKRVVREASHQEMLEEAHILQTENGDLVGRLDSLLVVVLSSSDNAELILGGRLGERLGIRTSAPSSRSGRKLAGFLDTVFNISNSSRNANPAWDPD